MESLRTQFEVLGLEPWKFSKMPCSRLEVSTIFWLVENRPRSWAMLFRQGARQRTCEKKFWHLSFVECLRICGRRPIFFFFWDRLRFAENLRQFWAKTVFWRTLPPCVRGLWLGFEHSCPWPREGLSWEGVSLASNLVSSTPPLLVINVLSYFNYLFTVRI